MILNEKYTLSNGVEIPKLGLGTWMIPDEQTDEAVRAAVSLGYHHIDTAQAYGNEAGVGILRGLSPEETAGAFGGAFRRMRT